MRRSRSLLPALAALPALLGAPAFAQDIERGQEIYGTCAACHGDYGQGGKRGEYPRLAGQRAAYIEEQLRAYRERKRMNIPMFPYTQERELPDEDIRDVAAYLASIRLPTTPPEFTDADDALTRLLAMEKVMIVPRVAGDAANGAAIYNEECAYCHGKTGLGGGSFPMVVGQYTNYLARQMDIYIKGERAHDEDDGPGILVQLKASDIQDILAYLTELQHAAP
ncbi:MAG: c-type cytochrome [Steroidobacteraceae bacterium]